MKTALTLICCTLVVFICCCGPDRNGAAVDRATTLRFGTPMKVNQVNPLADYSYSIFAMLATHETLVRFDSAMRPVPQLAETWDFSPDGKTWTFRLKKNVFWHDGKPVTADDVTFTFAYMAAKNPASAWLNDLVADIRVDGSTITFKLKKPYSRFLINVGFIIRILPRHVWQKVENPLMPGDAQVTLGCGPFVFEGYDTRGKTLSFRKNKAYHGAAPAMEHLVFLTDLTFDSMVLALQRGDIDAYYKYASGFLPAYLPGLARNTGIKLVRSDGMGIPAVLGFNLKSGPTAGLPFRKALSHAMDYEKIGQSLLGDTGKKPAGSFVPPSSPFYLPSDPLTFSPEKCRSLLKESGYADTDHDGIVNGPSGKNLSLKLLTRSDLEGTDALIPILSHNLKQVGIGLSVVRADLSTWIVRVKENSHDMVLLRTTPWGMVMDAGCGSGYFDSRRMGGGTLGNVEDPIFHRLCDRILENTDPAVEKQLYHQMQHYYADHLPALALCWAVNVYPAAVRLDGLSVNVIEGGLANRETFSRITFITDEAL